MFISHVYFFCIIPVLPFIHLYFDLLEYFIYSLICIGYMGWRYFSTSYLFNFFMETLRNRISYFIQNYQSFLLVDFFISSFVLFLKIMLCIYLFRAVLGLVTVAHWLRSCGHRALEHRLSSCGTQA